jgi:hypothetical protein
MYYTLTIYIIQSLAWAELYLCVAAIVQRFDLDFDPSAFDDINCTSDQFIIGTTGRDGLRTVVSKISI